MGFNWARSVFMKKVKFLPAEMKNAQFVLEEQKNVQCLPVGESFIQGVPRCFHVRLQVTREWFMENHHFQLQKTPKILFSCLNTVKSPWCETTFNHVLTVFHCNDKIPSYLLSVALPECHALSQAESLMLVNGNSLTRSLKCERLRQKERLTRKCVQYSRHLTSSFVRTRFSCACLEN